MNLFFSRRSFLQTAMPLLGAGLYRIRPVWGTTEHSHIHSLELYLLRGVLQRESDTELKFQEEQKLLKQLGFVGLWDPHLHQRPEESFVLADSSGNVANSPDNSRLGPFQGLSEVNTNRWCKPKSNDANSIHGEWHAACHQLATVKPYFTNNQIVLSLGIPPRLNVSRKEIFLTNIRECFAISQKHGLQMVWEPLFEPDRNLPEQFEVVLGASCPLALHFRLQRTTEWNMLSQLLKQHVFQIGSLFVSHEGSRRCPIFSQEHDRFAGLLKQLTRLRFQHPVCLNYLPDVL